MTRFLALGVLTVLLPFSPGDAKTIKQTCKDQCVASYKACLNRSLNSQGRKSCKTARHTCNSGCSK